MARLFAFAAMTMTWFVTVEPTRMPLTELMQAVESCLELSPLGVFGDGGDDGDERLAFERLATCAITSALELLRTSPLPRFVWT